jgi:catechol 2,3-dioxygenase-like lactoylglutathione lyase family enzyme
MDAKLDHLVLWVDDQLKSLDFYERVVGLTGVRAQEFRDQQALFPSIRVSPDSIMDLMPKTASPMIDSIFGGDGAAGSRVHHVCLAVSPEDYAALRARLEAAGIPMSPVIANSYGAKGAAPESFYFLDPDGNVLEARHY